MLRWTNTQVLKTRVPKKKTNKDDNEHEELEMGRRSRSTRSKNLFGERRSNEEESRAGERRFDEEESWARECIFDEEESLVDPMKKNHE